MTGKNHNDSTDHNKPSVISDNWELIAEEGWLVGQHFPVSGHIILGRDSACDITIPGTHLSRQHAELVCKGSKLFIRDLESSNGTYVNEKRITETELNSGDTVRFDVLTFRVQAPKSAKDTNATMIRRVPKPQHGQKKAKPQTDMEKSQPPKTPVKQSSNRVKQKDSTLKSKKPPPRQNTITAKKTSLPLVNTFAVLIIIGIIASIGYLISNL